MDKKEYEPRKLFIGGLPRFGITPEKLRSHFARYGNVVEALVMVFRDGMGRGFGFVEFEDDEALLRALDSRERNNHAAALGRRVDVKRAEKKPEIRSITTSNSDLDSKIFVGGFGDTITKDHLIDYFERFGTIIDVVLILNRLTRKSRGFGFVTFNSKEAVIKVLKDQFHYLEGIRVETKRAEPRDLRTDHYALLDMHSLHIVPYGPCNGGLYLYPNTYFYYPNGQLL